VDSVFSRILIQLDKTNRSKLQMNLYRKTIAMLFGVVLAGLIISAAYAGDGKCDAKDDCGSRKCGLGLLGLCRDCGCRNDCDTVCRLKKEPLTEKVTCWTSEKEAICLPPRSKKGCRNSTEVSCKDGKAGVEDSCRKDRGQSKKVVWFDWSVPGLDKNGESKCSRTRTSKKLMRKEIEVPIKGAYKYSWETVKLCKDCADKYDTAPAAEDTDADIPDPPVIEARILYGRPVVERTVSYNQ